MSLNSFFIAAALTLVAPAIQAQTGVPAQAAGLPSCTLETGLCDGHPIAAFYAEENAVNGGLLSDENSGKYKSGQGYIDFLIQRKKELIGIRADEICQAYYKTKSVGFPTTVRANPTTTPIQVYDFSNTEKPELIMASSTYETPLEVFQSIHCAPVKAKVHHYAVKSIKPKNTPPSEIIKFVVVPRGQPSKTLVITRLKKSQLRKGVVIVTAEVAPPKKHQKPQGD